MTVEDRADRVEHEMKRVTVERPSAIVAIRDTDSTVVLSAGNDALGREGDADTIVPMFCLVKPLVAHAIDQAIHEGELSLDDCLGDLIDVHESLRPATVVELLEHRSGIAGPNGIDASGVRLRSPFSDGPRHRSFSPAARSDRSRRHLRHLRPRRFVPRALGEVDEEFCRADGRPRPRSHCSVRSRPGPLNPGARSCGHWLEAAPGIEPGYRALQALA